MGKIFLSINHPAGNKGYNFESFWGGRGRLLHHGGSSSCIFMVPAAKTKLFVLSKHRVGVYLLTARRPNTFAHSLISCALSLRHNWLSCDEKGFARRRAHQTPTTHNPGARTALSECACFWHFVRSVFNQNLTINVWQPEVIPWEFHSLCAHTLAALWLTTKETFCLI